MQLDMAKTKVINIRVDPEDKELLEKAAEARGLTLSGFALKTLMREAAREASERGRDWKVPPFFRTACDEAKRGGSGGYLEAGRLLILHAGDRAAEDLAEIQFYGSHLPRAQAVAGTLAWCERHFPDCLKIVPSRRREQFAIGILEAYECMEDEADEEARR